MKKSLLRGGLALLLIVPMAFLGWAQSTSSHSLHLPEAILWYQPTEAGIILAKSDSHLYGIDTEAETIKWQLPFQANVQPSDVAFLPNAPLALLRVPVGVFKTPDLKAVRSPLANLQRFDTYEGGQEKDFQKVLVDFFSGKIIYVPGVSEAQLSTQYHYLPSVNAVVVGHQTPEQHAVVMLDIPSASLKWQNFFNTPQSKGDNVEESVAPKIDPEGHLLYYQNKQMSRINALTGKVIWQKPLNNIQGVFQGPYADKVMANSSDEEIGLSMLSLQDGNLLQRRMIANLLRSEVKDVQTMEGEFMAVSKNGDLNFFDYETLQPKWSQSPKVGHEVNQVYSVPNGYLLEFDDVHRYGYLMVSKDGNLLWEEPTWLDGEERYMIKTKGNKIPYVTNWQAGILSAKNGKELMKKPLKLSMGFLFLHDEPENAMVFYQKGALLKLDYSRGKVVTISEDAAFGNGEDFFPTLLQKVDNGYLLGTEDALKVIAEDGSLVYEKYFTKVYDNLYRASVAVISQPLSTAEAVIAQQDNVDATNLWDKGLIDNEQEALRYSADPNPGNPITGELTSAHNRLQARKEFVQNPRKEKMMLYKSEATGTIAVLIDGNTGEQVDAVFLPRGGSTVMFDHYSQKVYVAIDEDTLQFLSLK